MARTLIMSPERVRRTLSRLAHEIIERNRSAENLDIFGIRHRGAVLAKALAREIEAIDRHAFSVHALDVRPYRDDLDPSDPVEAHTNGWADVTDRTVILVDDVLFTGRTARAALDALIRFGRPRSIQFVVLIDRGHREYPIQPNYVGRVIPTKHKERIVVEVDEGFAVYIEE
ncbi:MAG: bifunctional pyr operon transcriptional regulator/uracil phosphoribosyltransferase PyrR [Rhodothermales bacterium]